MNALFSPNSCLKLNVYYNLVFGVKFLPLFQQTVQETKHYLNFFKVFFVLHFCFFFIKCDSRRENGKAGGRERGDDIEQRARAGNKLGLPK